MGSRQSKRNIQFPVTVRQAQKLASNPSVRINELMQAVGLHISCSNSADRLRLLSVLAPMAQRDPAALIDLYDPEDEDDEDYDYEEEGQEQIGTDSPDAGSPAENGEGDRQDGDSNGGNNAAAQLSSHELTEAQPQAANGELDGEQGSGVPSALPLEGSDRGAGEDERGSEPGEASDGGSTSEGDRSSEQSQSSDRQPVASSSTALDAGERPDGNGTLKSSAQPRDASAQEPGGSHPSNVSGAPEQGFPEQGEPEQGEGDRASTESDSSHSSDGDGADGYPDFEAGTEAVENGVGEGVPQDAAMPAEGNQLGDDRPTHQKKWGKKFGEAEAKPSASAKDNYGGVTADLKRRGVDAKLLQLCRRRLAALVGDSSQHPSPRRDYTEFCTRLKTYRNPSPARREEQGRPVILIMADVSGSCRRFSRQSVAVAKAASVLGVPGADVLVLTHSNGYPQELEHNGEAVPLTSIGPTSASCNEAWYNALADRFQIQVVVALGDWDAADDYVSLMQHPLVEKFIWLDNAYCSSRGTVEDRTKMALSRIKDQGLGQVSRVRHKLTYRDGCKDAVAFINNIK